jgi:hypothetical protein
MTPARHGQRGLGENVAYSRVTGEQPIWQRNGYFLWVLGSNPSALEYGARWFGCCRADLTASEVRLGSLCQECQRN